MIAKEKLAGLPDACVAALGCVPFVLPTQWVEAPPLMATQLAMYTIHEEAAIRKVRLCGRCICHIACFVWRFCNIS